MLTDDDWCWMILILIYAEWCYLILDDADDADVDDADADANIDADQYYTPLQSKIWESIEKIVEPSL